MACVFPLVYSFPLNGSNNSITHFLYNIFFMVIGYMLIVLFITSSSDTNNTWPQPIVCYLEESGEWWGASFTWMYWNSGSSLVN
jgi:hypothetical protein